MSCLGTVRAGGFYRLFEGTGPSLYGTEPVWFYLANLFLNLGPLLLVSLLASVVCFMGNSLLVFSGMLGLAVFSLLQAHKEERFLFGGYPLFLLSIALLWQHTWQKRRLRPLLLLLVALSASWSVLRSMALVKHWQAPEQLLLSSLNQDEHDPRTVCYGEEWYRFPGHWYLPGGWRVGWLEHKGAPLLPQPYTSLRTVNPHLNDRNAAVPHQYLDYEQCDYIVQTHDQAQEQEGCNCVRMLEAKRTQAWARWTWLGPKQWQPLCLCPVKKNK